MKRIGYWKSRVVPTFKKLFDKIPAKKAPAADPEACKNFDDSKEAINKEIEEKKIELGPKVVEVYEATSAEVKALVREPKEDGVKEHSADVQKFLEALVKIEFPGSKAACEISSSFGPVAFIFEKVCVFLPAEEKPREVEIVEEVVKTEEPVKQEETKPEETTSVVDKEIEIVGEKKEEVQPVSVPVLAVAEETKAAVEEEKKPAVEEEKKRVVEEKKPAVEEEKPVVEEEKKLAVEEKKPVIEEKKPVEEAPKTEVVTAAPVVETPLTKAPEAPSKAPETPAAELPKA